jgi:hypothetical protein
MRTTDDFIVTPGARIYVGPHDQLYESTGNYVKSFPYHGPPGPLPNVPPYIQAAGRPGTIYPSPAHGFEGTVNTAIIMGFGVAAFLIFMKKKKR